jgi:aminoglycoside phosphotransferase (APT) family kinase protein
MKINVVVAAVLVSVSSMIVRAEEENYMSQEAALAIFKHVSPSDHVQIEPLHGGMIVGNAKFKVTADGKAYVVRLIDPTASTIQNEIAMHVQAADLGLSPHVHYCDASSIVMDFIPEHTLWLEQMEQYAILDAYLQTLARIATMQGSTRTVPLFERFEENIAALDPQAPLYQKIVAVMPRVRELMTAIKQRQPVHFCHGDSHPRNMFFVEGTMLVIDWSESGLSYPFFDLASVSVFFGLDSARDAYCLRRLLGHEPQAGDMLYFNQLKAFIRIHDVLNLLSSLRDQNPAYILFDRTPEHDFNDYHKLFARAVGADAPEFIYDVAASQFEAFLQANKDLEK